MVRLNFRINKILFTYAMLSSITYASLSVVGSSVSLTSGSVNYNMLKGVMLSIVSDMVSPYSPITVTGTNPTNVETIISNTITSLTSLTYAYSKSASDLISNIKTAIDAQITTNNTGKITTTQIFNVLTNAYLTSIITGSTDVMTVTNALMAAFLGYIYSTNVSSGMSLSNIVSDLTSSTSVTKDSIRTAVYTPLNIQLAATIYNLKNPSSILPTPSYTSSPPFSSQDATTIATATNVTAAQVQDAFSNQMATNVMTNIAGLVEIYGDLGPMYAALFNATNTSGNNSNTLYTNVLHAIGSSTTIAQSLSTAVTNAMNQH